MIDKQRRNFGRSSIEDSAIIEKILVQVERYKIKQELYTIKFDILMMRFKNPSYQQW